MSERLAGGTTSTALAEGALAPPEIGAPAPRTILPGPGRMRRVLRSLGHARRWKVLLLALALVMGGSGGIVYFGPASLRTLPPLQNAQLFDKTGNTLIAELRPEQNRVVVPLSSIPKTVQNAFVAAEDERFWSHWGIDPLAIMRAIGANARGDREGASTITQQYVKNTGSIGARRTLWRKLREAVAAIRLDRRYSKREILEEYLNSIYLGNGAYGVEAAARLYFGKEVSLVRLDEAALLAGITASPTRYDPRRFYSRAAGRRDYVLRRMRALRMITTEEQRLATAIRTDIAPPVRQQARAPSFVDWTRTVIKQTEGLGEDALYRGGLKVTTTLDLELQDAAEQAVAEILNEEGDPEAAVVLIDVATGGVRAMVGGRDRRLGDLNLVTQARRQTGSAFKPVVLAAALGAGKTLEDRYSAPGSIRLRLPGGSVWKVGNYDRRGYGRPNLERATAFSVNTVFAQLIRDVGPEEVVDVAKRLGITSRLDPVHALTLGTEEISPLELATAYATLAREGQLLKPTALGHVVDSTGKKLFKNLEAGDRQPDRGIDPAVASDVMKAMKSVVRFGTGRPARLDGYTTWGKTGTTEDHADAWFAGGAGGMVGVVWVGYPQGRVPMTDVHGIKVVGSSFPAKIWKRVMTAYLEKYRPVDDELHRVPPLSPRDGPAPPPPRPGKTEGPGEPPEEPSEEPNPLPIPTLLGAPRAQRS